MKKIFSISLLFLFLAQGFYLTLLSGYLQWERAFIIDNYCINKDQPLLLCSGRCYISDVLGEELESSSQEQSTAPKTTIERLPLTLFCESFQTIVASTSTSEAFLNSRYADYYFYQPISGVFHPPKSSTLLEAV